MLKKKKYGAKKENHFTSNKGKVNITLTLGVTAKIFIFAKEITRTWK